MSRRKKAESEFVPKVIQENWDDKPYSFAFVPNQIEENDNYSERLEGFPLNILFGGIAPDPLTGQESLVSVFYEPAPETYRENSRRKEMRYFTKPKNGYSISVICEKPAGKWRLEKFKGKQLIQTAFGSTFGQAMLRTTMGGLEADER